MLILLNAVIVALGGVIANYLFIWLHWTFICSYLNRKAGKNYLNPILFIPFIVAFMCLFIWAHKLISILVYDIKYRWFK